MTSPVAFAAGIRLDMSSGFAAIVVHVVPLVVYSMRLDTPVTVSLRVSSAIPVGNFSPLPGTATLLMLDDGVVAVALTRTMTVVATLPNELRGIVVAATDVHEDPLLRLYSIAVDTPVIMSTEPSNNAYGAVTRAGAVIVSADDANVELVALTRTCQLWEDAPMLIDTLVSPAGTAVKLPAVPTLYSIRSVTVTDSVIPSNLTAVAVGVAVRRGSITFVASDAGSPFSSM